MHKNIYASGFLYNPSTQQILLQKQQNSINSFVWLLIGGEGKAEEKPEKIFQKTVRKLLKINLALKDIDEVYSYFHKEFNKNHFILYTKIKKVKKISSKNGLMFEWFTIKQTLKLPMSPQTKHDIIVGQRVMDAKVRKSLGERTLE